MDIHAYRSKIEACKGHRDTAALLALYQEALEQILHAEAYAHMDLIVALIRLLYEELSEKEEGYALAVELKELILAHGTALDKGQVYKVLLQHSIEVGRWEEARTLLAPTLSAAEATYEANAEEGACLLADCLCLCAIVCHREEDGAEETLWARAKALSTPVQGSRHSRLSAARVLLTIGERLLYADDPARAEEPVRLGVSRLQALWQESAQGPQTAALLQGQLLLCLWEQRTQQYSSAAKTLQAALALYRTQSHGDYGRLGAVLCTCLLDQGRFELCDKDDPVLAAEGAEPWFSEALPLARALTAIGVCGQAYALALCHHLLAQTGHRRSAPPELLHEHLRQGADVLCRMGEREQDAYAVPIRELCALLIEDADIMVLPKKEESFLLPLRELRIALLSKAVHESPDPALLSELAVEHIRVAQLQNEGVTVKDPHHIQMALEVTECIRPLDQERHRNTYVEINSRAGSFYKLRYDQRQSKKYLTRAVLTAEENTDILTEAVLYFAATAAAHLGRMYKTEKQASAALRFFLHAIRFIERLSDRGCHEPDRLLGYYTDAGMLCIESGHTEQAATLFWRAKQISDVLFSENPKSHALQHALLCMECAHLRDNDKALLKEAYEAALKNPDSIPCRKLVNKLKKQLEDT